MAAGLDGRIAAWASWVVVNFLALLDGVLSLVGSGDVCGLLACPNLEQSRKAMHSIKNVSPRNFLKSVSL